MDNEERIVRLAKPIKKGLLRLVFSRFFVIKPVRPNSWIIAIATANGGETVGISAIR